MFAQINDAGSIVKPVVGFVLKKALWEKIEAYRQKAYNSGYQLRLFGQSAAVETSYKYSFAFDPVENHYISLKIGAL